MRVYDGSNAHLMTGGLVGWADLSEPLQLGAADWVLCLEVAEHIPSHLEPALLANIDEHATDGVLLSWSNMMGNGHVNVREPAYVRYRMSGLGFIPDDAATRVLRAACMRAMASRVS